jgi:predicted Na+-dependent transporter
MLLIVGVPVLAGQLLRLRCADWCDRHRGVLGHLTTLILLIAMHQMFSTAFIGGRGPDPLVIGLIALGMGVLHVLLLEAGWRISAGTARPQRIAVAICGSHKTATLGIPLISSLHVLQNVLDGLLGPWLSRRAA